MIRPKQGIQFFADFIPDIEITYTVHWYLDEKEAKQEMLMRDSGWGYSNLEVSGSVVSVTLEGGGSSEPKDLSFDYGVEIESVSVEDNDTSFYVYAISKPAGGGDTVSNIIVNGTTVTTVIVNGTEVNTVKANDTVVFAKEQESAVGTWLLNETVSTHFETVKNFRLKGVYNDYGSSEHDCLLSVGTVGFCIWIEDVAYIKPYSCYIFYLGSSTSKTLANSGSYYAHYDNFQDVEDYETIGLPGANYSVTESRRTITITGGDDAANSDFIAWLKANATKQDDGGDDNDTPELTTAAGQWKFNDAISSSSTYEWAINFTDADGTVYTSMFMSVGLVTALYYYKGTLKVTVFSNDKWVKTKYQTITITDGDEVADTFLLEFLQNNAQRV